MRFLAVFFLVGLPVYSVLAQTTPVATPPAQTPPVQTDVIRLQQVDVTAQQEQMLNSIDRKIYNVGKDIQSVTGSAADILQNIPSVQVDIDGNVSLRGDDSVQVLIDGRTTSLMAGSNRADVLTQLPADAIERIEVITNPSARYKPDGTGGIINIVMKKKRAPGYSATAHVTAGNDGRFGASLSGNYNPGKFNLSGTFSVREDVRPRTAVDTRNYIDPTTGLPASTHSVNSENSRPLYRISQVAFDWDPSLHDKMGETINYTFRTLHRRGDELEQSTIGGVFTSYDRLRDDPESERHFESKTTYEHDFGRDDHTLNVEFRAEHVTETDYDTYTNLYQQPVAPTTYDKSVFFSNEPGTEASVEYSNAISKDSKLELGYDRSEDKGTYDLRSELLNSPTGVWVVDPSTTNRFMMDQIVNALYGTYRRAFGNFGAMAGLRFEGAEVKTDQVTSDVVGKQTYVRVYPTLHLTYDLTDTQQLQLNYSHRVRRPESDDLNPYPQIQDPYNIREGNPNLKPQETHSVEAGYQYKQDDTTYLATAFYKYIYNSFTNVSEYINSTTLLTTHENLGKSQSGGLEFAATVSPWKPLSLNASSDIYYSQIDASNLGFSSKRSAITWTGKGSADYAWSKSVTVQLNCNYSAKRLTPQGYLMPGFVTNVGVKKDLKNQNLSLVFTVSDVFDSLKEESHLDTPLLHDVSIRRRSSRIFYAGLVYSFGKGKKKGKDDAMQFDNQL